MSILAEISRATYQAGTREWGPVAVPTGLSVLDVRVDRTDWTDAAARLAWTMELSPDAGATWYSLGGAAIDLATCGHAPDAVNPFTGTRMSGTRRHLQIIETPDHQQWIAGYDAAAPMPEGWQYLQGAEPASTTRRLRGTFTASTPGTVRVTIEAT